MNIFILDKDPRKAACMLCDKHVTKMILESGQLLATAHEKPPISNKGWRHHPCSKWTRKTLQNYMWLANHMHEICLEYTRRYDKVHGWQEVAEWFLEHQPKLPQTGLTEFVQAIAEDNKQDDVVEAYREYYNTKKAGIAKWKHSTKPAWFIPHSQEC